MYDSYNAQLASTHIQSLTIDNASKTQSLSNEIKDDVTDKNHKYNLYKQFVTWACKSCYVAPLTDYANNNIFQELPTEEDYFTNSDKRLYLDFRKNNGYTNELE